MQPVFVPDMSLSYNVIVFLILVFYLVWHFLSSALCSYSIQGYRSYMVLFKCKVEKKVPSEVLPWVLVTFYDIFFISACLMELFYLLILSVKLSDWKETRCGWLPVLTDVSACGLPIG